MTFQNELLRQWMNRIPAFSLSTGFAFDFNRIIAPLQGGSPVVFIDARERDVPKSLEQAFSSHDAYRNELLNTYDTCDFLSNETLAYFHMALEADTQRRSKMTDEVDAP